MSNADCIRLTLKIAEDQSPIWDYMKKGNLNLSIKFTVTTECMEEVFPRILIKKMRGNMSWYSGIKSLLINLFTDLTIIIHLS